MLCPRLRSCLALVSGLVSQLVSGLGCCVRLPSLVLLLSPNLSPIWAGVLRPPPWSRLSLVSGLVSQLVSGLGCCVRLSSLVLLLSPNLSPILAGMLCPRLCLVFLLSPVLSPNLSPVWDAVSACLVLSCSCLRSSPSLSFSCLPACLRSGDALVCGLGCCVRLPSLVLLLSPNLSPIWAGVLRPPPWSRLSLVSGLVSQLVSGLGCCVRLSSLVLLLSPNLSPILAGMLCPRLCLVFLLSPVLSPNLSLVWDAVSASLVSSSSCLRSCLPSWLRCCVGLPGLVFLLSLVLSPNLSPVWDAVSASLVLSCSCLRSSPRSQDSQVSTVAQDRTCLSARDQAKWDEGVPEKLAGYLPRRS